MYQVEGTAGPSVIWGEVVGIWEHFFSPVIMSQPLREPLPLDCELHKCFSFLLPTLLGGTGCLDWAEVGFSHNWAGSAVPCLSSFSWGQVLRSTECSGIFQNGSFSCPPPGSLRGFFCAIYCGNLIKLLEAHLKILWQLYYDWVLHASVTVQVLLSSTGSWSCFGWWMNLCSIKLLFSVFTCWSL